MKIVLPRLVAGSATIAVFSYLLAILGGLLLLVITRIGGDLLGTQGNLVLGAFLVFFPTPIKINRLVAFLGLVIIYLGCFAVAFRTKGGFNRNLQGISGTRTQRVPNWLVVMPLASSGLFLIVFSIGQLESIFGIPSGSLNFPAPYLELYGLTYSPILEEITFRISTLGLLVSLRTLWALWSTARQSRTRVRKLILLSFLFPDKAKAEAGLPNVADSGWRGVHWTEWTLLLFTSAVFGVDHLLSGSGWQAGKVLTAGLSGLVLGIAFLGYGAYASVLLHWFFNFYLGVFSIGADIVGGVFVLATVCVFFLTMFIGILGIGLGVLSLLPQKPPMPAACDGL